MDPSAPLQSSLKRMTIKQITSTEQKEKQKILIRISIWKKTIWEHLSDDDHSLFALAATTFETTTYATMSEALVAVTSPPNRSESLATPDLSS
jgi:hypothetical protein